MKKLKLLYGFSVLLLLLVLFFFINEILFFESINKRLIADTDYTTVFEKPSWWILNIVVIIILVSVWFVNRGLWSGIKNGLFENKAASYLNTGATLWLIVGYYTLIDEIISIINHGLLDATKITFLISILMLIIGYSLLFFVDVLKKGIYLKQENNLTI